MKIKGVDIEEINFLRDQIKHKFGSVTVFSMETGLQYRKTLNFFTQLEVSEELYDEIKKAYYEKANDRKCSRISEPHREKIRICILTHYRKATEFCKKYPQFDSVYISNVIHGRLKMTTPKFIELVKVLEKKHSLEINLD